MGNSKLMSSQRFFEWSKNRGGEKDPKILFGKERIFETPTTLTDR